MFRFLLTTTFLILGLAQNVLYTQHSIGTSLSAVLSDLHAAHQWGSLEICNNPHGSGHVMCVHYAAGSYSQTHDRDRGAGFFATPTSSHTAMMLSYDVFFADNFDWVKGGKLPGLWGGSTECSGGQHSENCFSTRFMWRSNGEGEVYAYIPREQEAGFCDKSDVHCNFDYGNSLGRGKWHFRKGVWQNIAQYVHLNTPGQHNGYINVYLDGQRVYRITNLNLRNKDSIHIDGMMFSTFFGGSDSSWASPHSTYAYFKNFVISMGTTPPIIG